MPLSERNGNDTPCRILIVENSNDVRAGLRKEIEQLGHEVTVVSERHQALAYEDKIQFDLLVSDLVSDRADSDIVRSF